MEFVELKEDEFNKVSNNFTGTSFYQSSAWAEIKSYTGWIHYYVGVLDNDKIVACGLILGKKVYLNRYMYYSPRGLLLDYNNQDLLNFFIKNIKEFLKKKNGISFKIDPLVPFKNHDKYGLFVDDGFSNQSVFDSLIKIGFKHRGFTVGYSDEAQFRWTYCLDINVSKDDLFKNMDQRCRRCIRKYEKYPLEIVDVNDDNIMDFKDIMEHTARRQNHFDRSLDYYKHLDKLLEDKSKLVIIYLDREKFLNSFDGDKLYDMVKADKRKKIPISAGLFIFDSDRANYVYGGTYKDYMPLMAQYKLQMEMIYLAIEKGIPLYDFGGISGDFTEGSENYGVYEFKRGFGGYVVEYIGEFDLIINKLGYFIYDKGYGFYRSFKHFIAKIIKR